jgi:L-rhamnose mutarotase
MILEYELFQIGPNSRFIAIPASEACNKWGDYHIRVVIKPVKQLSEFCEEIWPEVVASIEIQLASELEGVVTADLVGIIWAAKERGSE